MYNKFYSSSSLFFKKKNIIYNIRDSLIFEIELFRKNVLLFSLKKFMTKSSIITINPIIQTFTFIKQIFYIFFYVIIFNLKFI